MHLQTALELSSLPFSSTQKNNPPTAEKKTSECGHVFSSHHFNPQIPWHVTSQKSGSKVSISARRRPSGTRSGCLRPFDQVVSFKGDQKDLEKKTCPWLKKSSKSYLFIYMYIYIYIISCFFRWMMMIPFLGTTPHFPKNMEQLVASKELKGVVFLFGATSTTDRLPKYTGRYGGLPKAIKDW